MAARESELAGSAKPGDGMDVGDEGQTRVNKIQNLWFVSLGKFIETEKRKRSFLGVRKGGKNLSLL